MDPQLVVRWQSGEIMSRPLRADQRMLLNEFLKEHKKVEQISKRTSRPSQLESGMEVLTAQLKEQAAQIQKVSAQLRDEQARSKS